MTAPSATPIAEIQRRALAYLLALSPEVSRAVHKAAVTCARDKRLDIEDVLDRALQTACDDNRDGVQGLTAKDVEAAMDAEWEAKMFEPEDAPYTREEEDERNLDMEIERAR